MIAIDRMTPGSPPAGFTFARTGKGPEGQWTVVEDPTASMGRAIEQSNTDRTDYRFPLAIHDSLSAANLDVELRFKAVGGKVDQAGGIALRLADADNYYVVRANAMENNFRLYAYERGRHQLATARVQPPALEQWHSLRVVAVGEHIQASLNGVLLLEHRDSRYRAGQVGLWTKADSITAFDDLVIHGVPGT